MSTSHSKAAAEFLKDRAHAKWHDDSLWMVRARRDHQSHEMPEWEELRHLSRDIKQYSQTHLPELIEQFEHNATSHGCHVHYAKDEEEYRTIIHGLLHDHGVKRMVKSKSMLSEECNLDHFLISRDIDAIESDLGELIVQLLGERPSHIVLPAIHLRRQTIAKLFAGKLGSDPKNDDPTYLTYQARKYLRQLFLHVDAAMTGANFAVASTGEAVVCTNEGNADMGMSCQKLNITAFGIDKIIPDLESLSVFVRLLGRSGTGQPITTYTSHYGKPHKGGEQHFIITDNGRSDIIKEEDFHTTLNCLRCGACMNTCPVYRRSGGFTYSYFIPGPIGINLGMLKNPKEYAGNMSACSLCKSCSDVCPGMVLLAEQIYTWRQKLDSYHAANPSKKKMSKMMQILLQSPALFYFAVRMAPITKKMPRAMIYNKLNAWGEGREMPTFASQSFNSWWKQNQKSA